MRAEVRQELENMLHVSKFLRKQTVTPKINGRHLTFLTNLASGRQPERAEKAPLNTSVYAAATKICRPM